MLIGRATRAQRFLMALPKRYETVARLGWTSSTGDVEGEIAPGRMPAEPLALPTGRIVQRPPAHSAVRVGGRRAYALARAGEAVEVPEREVEVHAFEPLWRDGERAAFAIECGSGTYVRSLIADLGDAYCLELRRTRIGPFDVADAGRFVPLDAALGFLRRSRWPARTRARPATASRSPARPGDGPAGRRRRPDRARRAAWGRNAQARRRLPRLSGPSDGRHLASRCRAAAAPRRGR